MHAATGEKKYAPASSGAVTEVVKGAVVTSEHGHGRLLSPGKLFPIHLGEDAVTRGIRQDLEEGVEPLLSAAGQIRRLLQPVALLNDGAKEVCLRGRREFGRGAQSAVDCASVPSARTGSRAKCAAAFQSSGWTR